MPKWMLFGLLAVGEFIAAAAIFFYSGRIVIPAILALSGVLMLVAAAGKAAGKK